MKPTYKKHRRYKLYWVFSIFLHYNTAVSVYSLSVVPIVIICIPVTAVCGYWLGAYRILQKMYSFGKSKI